MVRASLLEQDVDAIVNSVGLNPTRGGEIGQQLVVRIGDKLYEALRRRGGLSPGEVLVTNASPLPARYLFHVATENSRGQHTLDSIVVGAKGALAQAEGLTDVRSLALPSLGTRGDMPRRNRRGSAGPGSRTWSLAAGQSAGKGHFRVAQQARVPGIHGGLSCPNKSARASNCSIYSAGKLTAFRSVLRHQSGHCRPNIGQRHAPDLRAGLCGGRGALRRHHAISTTCVGAY